MNLETLTRWTYLLIVAALWIHMLVSVWRAIRQTKNHNQRDKS